MVSESTQASDNVGEMDALRWREIKRHVDSERNLTNNVFFFTLFAFSVFHLKWKCLMFTDPINTSSF